MAQPKSNLFIVYLLWMIATTVGWMVGPFHLDSEVKTYLDIARLLPIYVVDAVLIGLITGLGQALILKNVSNLGREWIWATVLGYGFAFLTGLLVSVLIPSVVWLSRGEYLLPLSEPSTAFMWVNMDDLFWGGFLIGAIQWRILRRMIPDPKPSKGMAWTLAPWFVLGLSIFVRSFTYGSPLAKFQMGMMGIVMGALTGLLLVSFLRNSEVKQRSNYSFEH